PRAHRRLPRLRLPRPAARLRHHERPPADAGRAAGANAPQELPDHPGLHQHDAPGGGGGGRAARPRGAEEGGSLMAAWIFQDSKQVKKHGADGASWFVGWVEAGRRRCRSCGAGPEGKALAGRLKLRIDAALSREDSFDPLPSHKLLRDLRILTAEGEATLPHPGTGEEERVYFAEGVGLDRIKIGVAVNVAARLRALDAMSPVPVRLLGVEAGGRARESELHRRFAPARFRGEWFEATAELRDYIRSFATPPERISELELRATRRDGGCGRTINLP